MHDMTKCGLCGHGPDVSTGIGGAPMFAMCSNPKCRLRVQADTRLALVERWNLVAAACRNHAESEAKRRARAVKSAKPTEKDAD